MRRWVLIVAATLFMGAPGSAPALSAAGTAQVTITLSEFKFTPARIQVKPGAVRFVLKNSGVIGHTFVIEGLKMGTKEIAPGKEVALEVEVKPGTYEVVCDIPGHKEAGMVLILVVK